MADHERQSQTDEWYTPAWIFEALGVQFDLDPCAALADHPANDWCTNRLGICGLREQWNGSVWLNPPFGGRNGIRPWLEKLIEHGDGIAIVPNRTATDWFQDAAEHADCVLFVRGKVKFLRPDGSEGRSPGYGNVLLAYGTGMAGVLRASSIPGLRCVLS